MYESKMLKLREVPVFSLADVSQIVSGKEYAKKLLRRMVDANEVKKIKRDYYSFYDDPFLVSTFLVKPSYISSASALSYHRLITQIPKDIFCCTTKRKPPIKCNATIRFFHTNYFFGFAYESYEHFQIPIAIPEKAIIDSIGVIPFSIFEEALENIRPDVMLDNLKKINKSSLLKRMGFLLENIGFDVYKDLRKRINARYIYLDPVSKKAGKKDKKWKVIINTER